MLAIVESKEESIEDVAVRIGVAEIGPEESFVCRLHKRGSHELKQDTAALEREIGGGIWTRPERQIQQSTKR